MDPRLTRPAFAIGLMAALIGTHPAGAQMIYAPAQEQSTRMPDRAPDRRPERPQQRPDEPRRPRAPGYPGIGIIAVPPMIYTPAPQYEAYEDPPPPRERTKAKKPPPKKPVAKKPPPSKPATTTVRTPAAPPPVAVTPDHVPDEVVFELRPDVSPAQVEAVLRRFALTPIERIDIALLGTSIQHARVARGSRVETMVRQLAGDPRVASAQPNFVFAGQTEPASTPANAPPEMAAAQYAPDALKIPDAHRLARGTDIVVAVIDSGVDPGHPELEASLIDIGEEATPHVHGTGMAGAIAAHARLVGIAPGARILALDALKYDRSGGAKGTSLDIIRALDIAARQGARVVNLSFAGPSDELMARALRALHLRGAVLVAAAGNAGPKSKPLYPAAHPDVIAVTATDSANAIYAQANIGAQIGVAAPGVDVLVPAPGGTYQMLSGTSLASAHVSGVAALMLERRPDLDPATLRAVLTRTARDLGKPGRDEIFGAGLVDASASVSAATEPAAAAPEATVLR